MIYGEVSAFIFIFKMGHIWQLLYWWEIYRSKNAGNYILASAGVGQTCHSTFPYSTLGCTLKNELISARGNANKPSNYFSTCVAIYMCLYIYMHIHIWSFIYMLMHLCIYVYIFISIIHMHISTNSFFIHFLCQSCLWGTLLGLRCFYSFVSLITFFKRIIVFFTLENNSLALISSMYI